MRRSPIALLMLVCALLLAACGGTPAAQQPTSPPAATAAPAAPTAAPTVAPTTAPTIAPTAAPTAAPTEAPTEAAATASELTIFAAASLTDAFEEIATAFEAANPGTEITYNFAGSQQLAAQLNEGAPADVFASANGRQMEVAIEGTRVVSGTQKAFVRNRLVVITPKDNPAGITTLQDLAKPGLKLILADAAVPVGQYSLDFLGKASATAEYSESYSPTVLANVVSFEDNVRSVLTKVALGEGDAGIVYTTDAALDADNIGQIAIPDALNTIASYPIALVADSANATLAQAFIDYVLGPEGQQTLVKYGFISTIGTASGAAPGAVPVAISGLIDTPRSFSAEDLATFEQVEITVNDRDGAITVTGVLLNAILDAVGVQNSATTVVFTGGDGYTAELPLADLQADADAILAVDDNGAIRNVLPSQRPRFWVKGLVTIEIK
ncbi:MAG: molybdate ABC transporter substrate-binding protein [Roseiflexaceae bacterium]|nr:molybdate ABC transporter substrate-binding protein [Roseiflexaceae bacterium]